MRRHAADLPHLLLHRDHTPETIELPNQKLNINGQSRAIIVDDKTGETSIDWCTGVDHLDAAGKPTVGAGYCTVSYDNGDESWFSYTTTGGNQIAWTVMGGMGKYVGATGSGTSSVISSRGDGASFAGKAKEP